MLQHIEASSLGRIRYVGPKRQKIDTGHIIPQQIGNDDYRLVTIPALGDAPRRKTLKVHRLVALAFHGLPPLSDKRIVVGHLDDDPGNNRPQNLRWMTQAKNCNAPGFIAKQRARSGEKNPFYGRQHSAETRAKISEAKRGTRHTREAREKMSGENHWMFGRQHSPETRARISAAKREGAARRRLEKLATPEAGSARHA